MNDRPSGGPPGGPVGLATLGESGQMAAPPPRYPFVTRLLLPALLLLSFGAVAAWTAGGSLVGTTDVRVVPVLVREVQSRSLASSADGSDARQPVVQASGWIEPDPYPVLVNALADGVVREVLVLEGDRVEADQPVARLVEEDAALALRQAEAESARVRARHDAARTRWENPVARELAVEGATARVAETRAELGKLASDIAVEKARAAELGEILRQVEASHRGNAATEAELATARHRWAAQQAALASAEARRPVLEAQVAARQAELAAAQRDAELRVDEREALATAEAALAQAQAERDQAALRLERMTVRSPAGGVVMTRHVDVGSKVVLGADQPLSAAVVRLFDPRKLQVRVDVPLADVAKVGVGMPAEVIVSVLPDRTFAGRVTRVVHEADVTRNTLQVKVAVNDPDPQLKPEMLARVKFLEPATSTAIGASTGPLAVFAPDELVESDGASARVWIVDMAEGVAGRRDVVLGEARDSGWVEVASGLMPGDRLIVDPAGLRVGDHVRVVGEGELAGGQGGSDGVH